MPVQTLDEAALLQPMVVSNVGGHRSFRRRLLELGMLPGATVCKTKVAPLGDPIELEVRGRRLSLRRSEAREISVRAAGRATTGSPTPARPMDERSVS